MKTIYNGNYLTLKETDNFLRLELTGDGKTELLETFDKCGLCNKSNEVYESINKTFYAEEKGFRCAFCHNWREVCFTKSYDVILSDLFEDIQCNSEIELLSEFDYAAIGALTSAPIIAFDVERNDNGELESVGNLFWFERYAIASELEEMLLQGFVDFPKAH